MPLPNTRVIPAGWSAHHRPTAEQTMTATCTITRPGTGDPVVDIAAGTATPPAPTPVASGVACRVQALPLAVDGAIPSYGPAGQARPPLRRYLVAVPQATAAVHVGDLVDVTASNDPGLAGRTLRVVDVLDGSETWQQDLHCVDDLTP